MNRFDYVKYDDKHTSLQTSFKEKFMELEKSVNNLGASRSVSLVLTKLEEAYMWIGKEIRDQQIQFNLANHKECKDTAERSEI